MPKKECQEHIPIYTPAEVFAVGTYVDALPQVDAFSLHTKEERFRQGLVVQIGLVVAAHNFELDAKVVEFEQDEHVLIKGSSHIGKAAVWLNLAPHSESGTLVDYGISIKHSLLTKFAEPIVAHHLETTMPEFAAGYRQNVVARLDAQASDAKKAA